MESRRYVTSDLAAPPFEEWMHRLESLRVRITIDLDTLPRERLALSDELYREAQWVIGFCGLLDLMNRLAPGPSDRPSRPYLP